VVVLSGKEILKGLIAAGLGLIISQIGFVARSGTSRFTFGSTFLYEGIALSVMGLGVFGVAVLYETLSEGEATITSYKELPKMRDVLSGVRDVFHHWRIFWMSTFVAAVIGVLPGVGRQAAAWTTYAIAQKMSKNPEEFGTGRIEGVIAPETANNATSAGDLLTTLAFGIPGSSVMALYLGALIMAGYTPGPQLMREHMDLVYILVIGIAIANIIGGAITLFGASQMAKLAFIDMDYMFPALISLIVVAAYVTQDSIMTMLPLVFGAFMGITMKKFGYPIGPMVLAFVMGDLFEYFLFNALDFWGPFFLLRPIPLTIIIGIVVIYFRDYVLRSLRRIIVREVN
jgi:putative tricarboxylic transport membrane protein